MTPRFVTPAEIMKDSCHPDQCRVDAESFAECIGIGLNSVDMMIGVAYALGEPGNSLPCFQLKVSRHLLPRGLRFDRTTVTTGFGFRRSPVRQGLYTRNIESSRPL